MIILFGMQYGWNNRRWSASFTVTAWRLRLAAAFAEFDPACDNVPHEWWLVDNGVPTGFNRDAAREVLSRFMHNDFWRIA